MVQRKVIRVVFLIVVFVLSLAYVRNDVLACWCEDWECYPQCGPAGCFGSYCECVEEVCGEYCQSGEYACGRGCCDVGNSDPDPTDPPCEPSGGGCGDCSVECGGGTQTCDDGCTDWTETCNNQACCTATNPGAVTLVSPEDEVELAISSVTLSWNAVGSWGTGCPSNDNDYLVYAEAGDATPDVLVATVNSSTTSYDLALDLNREYYWRVEASNGSIVSSSETRSFIVPGMVTGTLFDASEVDNCALMASQLKVSGAVVNLDSATTDYSLVSSVLGVYSQLVEVPNSYTVIPVVGGGFMPTAKLTCQGTSADFVIGGSGTVTRDFGFWRIYGGWWQVIGGDVYGGLGMESIIPNSLSSEEKFLIKDGVGGNGGVAHYGTGDVEIGGGTDIAVSESGWEAESGYLGQDVSYEYYMAKMRILDKTEWDGTDKPGFDPIEGYEVYTHTGDIAIDFGTEGDEKMIFMVDGDILVDGDVLVELGSHLTVISSGTITLASNVAEVHGWWVADRIVVESTGDEATDIQFKGEGSFVGWDAIELNRDRGVTNNTEPSEVFEYRPDLMINAPDALKFSRYTWLEQVP
jgi:hypothetical protein